MSIRSLYESNDEMFRDFREDREAAVARAAAYYAVLPEIVLANVQHLEATHRDHPRAIAFFDSEVGAFRRADLVLRDLQRRTGLKTEGARILDIGCGGGHAMRAAWGCGAADVRGLELSEGRASLGNEMLKKYRLPPAISAGSILDPKTVAALGGEYDAVFMFDLLEHVPSIDELLGVARSLLKTGGVAVIRSGNPYNPELLLREPHYGCPGMTLLSRYSALEYFDSLKSDAGAGYEVFEWLCHAEIEARLRAAGFVVEAVPQERTHPLSDFDRVAVQLTAGTDYPSPRIAAEIRQSIRLLQLLREKAADAEELFGVMIYTIAGRAAARIGAPGAEVK